MLLRFINDEEGGQRLEHVDQAHLVLASGKQVLQNHCKALLHLLPSYPPLFECYACLLDFLQLPRKQQLAPFLHLFMTKRDKKSLAIKKVENLLRPLKNGFYEKSCFITSRVRKILLQIFFRFMSLSRKGGPKLKLSQSNSAAKALSRSWCFLGSAPNLPT